MNLPRLLDDSMNEVKRLHPTQLSISEKIVPLSTARMGLLMEETVPERSWVELYKENTSAGIYRSKTPEIGFGDRYYNLELEHAICEVGDWLITADIPKQTKTLANAISTVWEYYRGDKWQLGSVTPTGSVVLNVKYGNLLSTMNSLIAQIPNARMTFNFTTTPWTVSVTVRNVNVSGEGRLSRNVQSAVIKKDTSNLCTRVYVQGLGTNGAIGYMDADTVSTYGIIEGFLSGTGYTLAQAQTIATQYLNQHKNPKYTVDISLMDLYSITNDPFDSISLGKLYRLAIPDDNVMVEEHIISIEWSDLINSPMSARVTLAHEDESLIQFVTESAKAAENVSDDLYEYADGIARDAEQRYVGKIAGISTIDDILREALDDAEAAATSAASGCIAKTSTYQTAEAIVSAAAAIAEDDAGLKYVAKTQSYQTADAIVNEAVRVSGVNAAAAYIAKTGDYATVSDLLSKALTDAQSAASTAAAGCIAKTSTYQTADAIVSSAVAAADTQASGKYIAQTTSFQTADAIKTEAVRLAGVNAASDYIAKSGTYGTVQNILDKALTDAQSAATTAASGCIAKTTTYQTASAIVSAAVSAAETSAGNTYIAKTTSYQTADAIVQAAESYTDGVGTQLSGSITTMSNKIALVVSESGGGNTINAASIVAAINAAGSSVVLDADHIDLNGYVTIGMLSSLEDAIDAVDTKATNAKNEADGIAQQLQTGLTVTGPVVATGFNATTGYVLTGSLNIGGYDVGVEPITINGTQYLVCTATAS